MSGEVVSVGEAWRARAKAANDAADELDGLVEAVASTLRNNQLGLDCIEGEELFKQLSAIAVDWRLGMRTEVDYLKNIARRCIRASEAYGVADGA
ncbi:MAG: hypothetical protein QM809_18630 [Gordonia sp. (in: high G+C Gram-positive bacteria)]|uniref:hypothetical protein n=1 Tax=Gordonia sp. (in: high G+C Gram-positive bacteria) TaxID=84139 RepID=UPI0039E5CBD9